MSRLFSTSCTMLDDVNDFHIMTLLAFGALPLIFLATASGLGKRHRVAAWRLPT